MEEEEKACIPEMFPLLVTVMVMVPCLNTALVMTCILEPELCTHVYLMCQCHNTTINTCILLQVTSFKELMPLIGERQVFSDLIEM